MNRKHGLFGFIVLVLMTGIFVGCSQREKFTLHEYKVRFVGEPGVVAECKLTLVNKGISSTTNFAMTTPAENIYLAEGCRVELKTSPSAMQKEFYLELWVDGHKSTSVHGRVAPGMKGTCSVEEGFPEKKEAATEPATVPAM